MKVGNLLLLVLFATLTSCATQSAVSTNSSREHAEISAVEKRHARLKSRDENSSAEKNEVGVFKANALRKKYAAKLQIEDEKTLENATLLAFIDDWYGAPYKYAGRDKKGIDCSGFTCALYQNVYGVSLSGSSSGLYQQCERVKRAELREGDLVFFKIYKGRISHVGVYVANNYFVHASTKAGVVLNSLDEDYYRKYYAGAGRIKN